MCSLMSPVLPAHLQEWLSEAPSPGDTGNHWASSAPSPLHIGYFFGLEYPSGMTGTPQLYGLRFSVTRCLTISIPKLKLTPCFSSVPAPRTRASRPLSPIAAAVLPHLCLRLVCELRRAGAGSPVPGTQKLLCVFVKWTRARPASSSVWH